MKHTTFVHHKLIDLAEALGADEAKAVGTLGFLWHAAGEYAPCGDIGRFSDEKIAWFCRWKGDPKTLVDALVAARWLDPTDGPARLVVHDWPVHCEDFIHSRVARLRAFFANGCAPSLRGLRSDERPDAERWYKEQAEAAAAKVKKPRQRRPKAENAGGTVHKTDCGQSTGQTVEVHTHDGGALTQTQTHTQTLPSPHPNPSPRDAKSSGRVGSAAPGLGSGGSGGLTVTEALARVGVNAASIAVIADCPAVTTGEIRREWESIVRANGTVKSRPGLLVDRLCKAHGIQRAPPKAAASVGDMLAMARIHRLREQAGNSG